MEENQPHHRSRVGIILFGIAALVLVNLLYFVLSAEPRNDRLWREDLAILPETDIERDYVRVRNVRNFWWHAPNEFEPAYYDADFELDELSTMYFAVTPFSDFSGAAHTFLTFQFDASTTPESVDETPGPKFLSVSVEARKEEGEGYSALKGLFHQYELMYVLADERDMVTLRTHVYGNDVFLYPIDLPKETIQKIFISVMEEVNTLKDTPAFYNTLVRNCTTELVRHINAGQEGAIPFSLRYVLPGYADSLAYDLGLIDTELPFAAAEARFNVTERSRTCANSTDFSLCIRGMSPELQR